MRSLLCLLIPSLPTYAPQAGSQVPSWAVVLEQLPDPALISDPGLRSRIVSSGLPWLVKDKATSVELVLVPSGTFMQGSSADSGEVRTDESPIRKVTISEPFYMGRRELTQLEWSRLSGQPVSSQEAAQLAATGISHVEAVAVLGRHALRLPTEAEWEYASHACGTWSHEGALEAFAWHRANAEGALHAVGTLQPNGLGLYDMLGNVEEWCSDWYSPEEYARANEGIEDPLGPTSGLKRVLRGGSWLSRAVSCRSTSRGSEPPQFESSAVGVRVACSVMRSETVVLPPAAASPRAETTIPMLDPGIWAEIIEQTPDSNIVRDLTLRVGIEKTGLPWRVKDRRTGIELLLVPPSKYLRGAEAYDTESDADERPAHEVTLTRPFYLSRYEVTQEQWQQLMGSPLSGNTQKPLAPITSINFDDVLDFCRKSGMRLPSEAEWEFACKAGSSGSRYGPLDAVAWHSSNSQATTHPVGQKLPNSLGFHDMLGNVRELCSDVYRWESYADCLKGVIDPVGPASGALRVCRGGTFLMGSRELRSTYRSYVESGRRDISTGFRPARTP